MNGIKLIANTIQGFSQITNSLTVRLSNELVQLLSEQLYRSPVKAIEELVVNAYDANAKECRIFVPPVNEQSDKFIIVYDNGIGMDYEGLVNLWQIGRSTKRSDDIHKRTKRKQIGKFGIGKLATYTICHRLTYVTKSDGKFLSVSIDFRSFSGSDTDKPINLDVREINDWQSLETDVAFSHMCQKAAVDVKGLFVVPTSTWTICVLEELKEKATSLKNSRLTWVLQTAMPLHDDFRLYLNGELIQRSEEEFTPINNFSVMDLPANRLNSLEKSTGEKWEIEDGKLVSPSFPSGITGQILITRLSLVGKSSDLSRSHGFFIRARGRLLNEEDAYFGITHSSYETFARFRADIDADDLDNVITAPREGIEDSTLRDKFEILLGEIFNEARGRYQNYIEDSEKREGSKNETSRNFVAPRLVEQPIADVLSLGTPFVGSEADDKWFFLDLDQQTDFKNLIENLYNQPRSKYTYIYSGQGATSRLVKFEPQKAQFVLNSDHEFVRAHSDEGRSRILLEDIATAEVLLEVYLRESQVPISVIGEVLEKRDSLLRSLAKDHPFSLKSIATALRDASASKYDLEIALVAAARALGFVATHIGGAGQPDGIARFTDYPSGEKKITLEAKSSQEESPKLAALDISGLGEHVRRNQAQGCLLIAPNYPGRSKADSATANRAISDRISCWTIEQLARLVETAEARHINATTVIDIVLNFFSPDDVSIRIETLLAEPTWTNQELYLAIIDALEHLEFRLCDAARNVAMISAEVSAQPSMQTIKMEAIRRALSELAAASQGLITITDREIVIVHGSYDEIRRRLVGITKTSGSPRRPSNFRNGFDQ